MKDGVAQNMQEGRGMEVEPLARVPAGQQRLAKQSMHSKVGH
jgi:hypothetical protein